MMEEPEVKHEFDRDEYAYCRTCLSVGRRLLPLGKYANIYRKLTSEYDLLDVHDPSHSELQVCWECYILLHKAVQFQLKVQRANEMLLLGQGNIYGSLSNLTTLILNDSHPNTIYLNDDTKQTVTPKIEIDLPVTLNEENTLLSDDLVEDIPDIQTDVSTNKNEVIKKVCKTNRWAKKRALQNKKPKFKIIGFNEAGGSYRRVQIDIQEMLKCIEMERNSEYYMSKKYKCEQCVLGFSKYLALEKHNEKIHSEVTGSYICDICNARMNTKHHLSIHMKQHFYRHECKICNFACYRRKRMTKHVETQHRKVFQCLKCALKFGGRREFFKHFKEWHEMFICDYCGTSFKMRYCIKDHIRKQHSPFECKMCDKRFARYNGLWLHNKTRHSPPTAGAYCVECDKRYVDIYRYRWHLANSARHKPRKLVRVPCPGCEKVFSKNIYMKDHYTLVHLKQYKYRCEECDKNFIRNADLMKHRRRVHEGILPPRNKICYMCGRGFSTNKILSNHVRTHTGERPHACALCPAAFGQRAALRAHARALHH